VAVDVLVQAIATRYTVVAEMIGAVVPAAGKRAPVRVVASHVPANVGLVVEESRGSGPYGALTEQVGIGVAME
jgi:hypothetical protein